MFNFVGDSEIYRSHFLRLCREAKKLDIPLEINFLGLATGRAYPKERFFKLAAEVGNDIIFGADAHRPDAVCKPDTIEAAKAFAASLGLKPIDTVKLRKI